jgi:hypothetical protein
MSAPKMCIFCGKEGGHREHIVSEWLLRDLDLYKTKTRLGFGVLNQSGQMDEIQAPQPASSFVTDAICANCNNVWMSDLEKVVKPLLTPLLSDPWPANHRQLFSSLFLQSAVITRWLLKTACTFGEKMSVQVPEDIRRELYAGRLNPEIKSDISYNDGYGAYVGMSRSWPCFKDGKIEPREIPNRSFRFVWQMKHLAMRIAYFPGCEKMMTPPRYPVRLYPKFGISPDYQKGGLTKPSYYYNTLEELEHDTIYALR